MEPSVIADESLKQVMEEVTTEIACIFAEKVTMDQNKALSCFLMTLAKMSASLFDWLPPGEEDSIITACGTWFDIGVIFGKSPERLVKILERANPSMVPIELPAWLEARFKEDSAHGQRDEG